MKFERLLKKLSKLSTYPKHKMSCVIVRKNKVVSTGFNKLKTSPRSPDKYNMLHAEISALLSNSGLDLKGCTAYIYRERKDGKLALSKPCSSCSVALKQAGIKKVIYSSEEGYKEEAV